MFVLISIDGCPEGQYLDGSSVCQPCKSGCKKCKNGYECDGGSKVGAILGGVLGGLALIAIIVVVYVKRDSLKRLVS